MSQKKAVVLLSGGLDSTTVLAIAKNLGYDCYALSFAYGQRHCIELEAARKVARVLGASEHIVAHIDLRCFGGSALTSDLEVPKGNPIGNEAATSIPVTYVPARNAIFLSFGLAWAEVLGANDLFIGVNALDYSGYPDCRPEFIDAYQRMADLATRAGVEGAKLKIHTPLISMSKAEIIQKGLELGVDYSSTITCYDPSATGVGCGQCEACLLRLKGFAEAGVQDSAPYAKSLNVGI